MLGLKRGKSEPCQRTEPAPAPEPVKADPVAERQKERANVADNLAAKFIEAALSKPEHLDRLWPRARAFREGKRKEYEDQLKAEQPDKRMAELRPLAEPKFSEAQIVGEMLATDARQIASGIVAVMLPMPGPAAE